MGFLQDVVQMRAAKRRYDKIKSDPDRSEACVKYGFFAIWNTLLAVAASVGLKWGLLYFTENSIGSYLIAWVIVAVCGLIALAQAIQGVVHVRWQLKLNKKAIGYVALLLWILGIVAVGIIIAFLKF